MNYILYILIVRKAWPLVNLPGEWLLSLPPLDALPFVSVTDLTEGLEALLKG